MAATEDNVRAGFTIGGPRGVLLTIEFLITDEFAVDVGVLVAPESALAGEVGVRYASDINNTGLVARLGVGARTFGGTCPEGAASRYARVRFDRYMTLTAGPGFHVGSEPMWVLAGVGRVREGATWCPPEETEPVPVSSWGLALEIDFPEVFPN